MYATLPRCAALTASCSSGQHFASGFLQISSRDEHPCLPLTLPLTGCVEDFHLLVVLQPPQLKNSASHGAHTLQARGVKLALGATLYDPGDPMGKMFFNVLATFAEFEGDLIRRAHGKVWQLHGQRENCGGSSQNYQINNKKNFAVCMKPGSTQSAIWLNCFQFHVQQSTGHFCEGKMIDLTVEQR